MATFQTPVHLDALVVGAGFGGIYQLYSLLKLGLNVKAIEKAEGLGGVWYWNKYPGAMSDTESFLYRYSWDKDDLKSYPWPNNYLTRDETVKYLDHVARKHHLYEHLQFSTEMLSAEWNENTNKWHVETSTGDTFIVTYLFTALGIQSTKNVPNIPGVDSFHGLVMHSSEWDRNVSLAGKRVGIVGCGSSGIQLTNAIAPEVAELHCFIRHPQFTIPLRFQPVPDEKRTEINSNYDDIWNAQRVSNTAFGFEEPATLTMSVTPEERNLVFEDLWSRGNGFRFMFGGFRDLCSNSEANEEACKFLRAKISAIVKDPVKAATLTPQDLFARRPPCDQGYYEKFNQDNVFAVDIKKAPIVAVEESGMRTADGKLHELDIIVFATGFQSGDGSYLKIKDGIKGRGGVLLSDHWRDGIKTYLSMFLSSFPNMFLVNGPQGPFSNAPTLIESEVDFLTAMLSDLHKTGGVYSVECKAEAESDWARVCDEVAASETLFNKVDSWLTGKNISGAKPTTKFYYGGLKAFRTHLQDCKERNYSGLVIS